METDDDLDTHICLSCQLPIIGLDNYVFHKKHECSAKKRKHVHAGNLSQPVSDAFSQVTAAQGDINGADGTALQVILEIQLKINLDSTAPSAQYWPTA